MTSEELREMIYDLNAELAETRRHLDTAAKMEELSDRLIALNIEITEGTKQQNEKLRAALTALTHFHNMQGAISSYGDFVVSTAREALK